MATSAAIQSTSAFPLWISSIFRMSGHGRFPPATCELRKHLCEEHAVMVRKPRAPDL